jgi:hypothetical protein
MLSRNLSRFTKSCCLAAVLAALPAAAFADQRGYDRGDRYRDAGRGDYRHHDNRPSVGIAISAHSGPAIVDCAPAPRIVQERVYVEPVYRTVTDRRWVEPVYRTVTDRVWVPPVVRTIPDRTWVPERSEWRDVYYYDHYGRRCVRQERVVVEAGHFVDGPRTVEIAPGRWDNCAPRQELVSDGHWEDCPRQELVAGGYWTTRDVVVEAAPPLPAPRYGSSHASMNVRFPIGH